MSVNMFFVFPFCYAVYVYDGDKIVVTLNYKDGAETVKSGEIDAVFGSTMDRDAPVFDP